LQKLAIFLGRSYLGWSLSVIIFYKEIQKSNEDNLPSIVNEIKEVIALINHPQSSCKVLVHVNNNLKACVDFEGDDSLMVKLSIIEVLSSKIEILKKEVKEL